MYSSFKLPPGAADAAKSKSQQEAAEKLQAEQDKKDAEAEEKRQRMAEREAALDNEDQINTPQDTGKKTYAIGIDLGTTYSCVGVMKDGNVEIIANDQGNRTTPSYVAWTGSERVIGDAAKNQAPQNPFNTIFDAKRLIGRKHSERIVQNDKKLWPFKVFSDGTADDKPLIEIEFQGEVKHFHAEEVSSFVLTKMKNTAESFLGTRVTDAVITVPAYFNDSQRQATKDAGNIASLNVLRIVNEPTAAAIAYGLDQKTVDKTDSSQEHIILVFDMGGGTFDVSILAIQDNVFEVRATAGDSHLGGEDFDNRILDHCIKEFKRKAKVDPSKNQRALRRLRTQCERAKRQLSTGTQVTIEVDSFHDGHDFSTKLSRAKFEELNMDYFKKAMEPVQQCLTDSNLPKTAIQEIVLVGGSTRIPKVQDLISQFFGGKELCKDINPDEAVAYGAAVQAAIVSGASSGGVSNMLLLDVSPLSLGIETAGGMMQTLIPRNSTIPTNKSQDFTTSEDEQDHVDIKVFEGERPMVKDNNFLGCFSLQGLPPVLKGVPKIKVTFNLDSEGILEIGAQDMRTKNQNKIEIKNEKGRLTQADIEKMLEDAEKFKDEDFLAQQEGMLREETNSLLKKCDANLDSLEEHQITEKDKEVFKKQIDDVKEWLEANPSAPKEDLEEQKKILEGVVAKLAIRAEAGCFWERKRALPEGEAVYDQGGFFLKCGIDIRSLMEEIE